MIFDVQTRKIFEILGALKQFGPKLLEIKQEKEKELAVLSSFSHLCIKMIQYYVRGDSMRLDKYLKKVPRIMKRRPVAKEVCR